MYTVSIKMYYITSHLGKLAAKKIDAKTTIFEIWDFGGRWWPPSPSPIMMTEFGVQIKLSLCPQPSCSFLRVKFQLDRFTTLRLWASYGPEYWNRKKWPNLTFWPWNFTMNVNCGVGNLDVFLTLWTIWRYVLTRNCHFFEQKKTSKGEFRVLAGRLIGRCCMQSYSIEALEKVQKRATKILPSLRHISYMTVWKYVN